MVRYSHVWHGFFIFFFLINISPNAKCAPGLRSVIGCCWWCPGMWHFHCTDASTKRSEGNKKKCCYFPPYYAPHPPTAAGACMTFPKQLGWEFTTRQRVWEKRQEGREALEDHGGKVRQPGRQRWGAKITSTCQRRGLLRASSGWKYCCKNNQ